jgi:ABC-type sugar transport system permease subunit
VLTVFPLLFQLGVSMTTLSGMSLRDGLQGGLWREIWGGLTGQIKLSADSFQQYSKDVHYIGLLAYPQVWGRLKSAGMPFFTVFWSVLSVSLQAVLGVSAAFLLWNKNVRGRRGWQLFFILPWAIPEAIAALVWLNIFAPFAGWLTLAVRDLGTNIPFASLVGWETNASQIMAVLLLASLWYGFPFMMLATSAGLKMLPAEVYDAAAMDGANAWQTLRHITGPLVWPLLVPAVIIRSIFAFNQFYLFQMFFPIYQRQDMMTFSSLSYYLLYQGSEFSISAVINIISILMLVVFVIVFNRWNKAGEERAYA